MSALPKNVKAQVDKANELIEQMKAAENPPEEKKAEEVVEAETEVEVEAEAEAPAPTPEPEPESEESGLEHKYKVLQGKYNAEVPRLHKQVKTQDELIGELRQRLTNTESMLAVMNTAQKPAKEPEPHSSLPEVSEDEIDQFGPDLIDLVERVSARRLLPEIDNALAPVKESFKRVEQNTSQVHQSMARSERERVLQDLAQAVPNWEHQNEDPEFLSWLDEIDVYAGMPRGELLTEAFRSHDTPRVIAIFKGFQTENAVVTPSKEPAPKKKSEPQAKLEDYVAPGTPKTGTTSAPNESGKRVWTRADIQSFFARKNELIRQGKPIPEEWQKLERDLFKAQSEGRVSF